MKFFVDTAATVEIRSLAVSGSLDGVTTNPWLVARDSRKFSELNAETRSSVAGRPSAVATATGLARIGAGAATGVLRAIVRNVSTNVALRRPEALRACRRMLAHRSPAPLLPGRVGIGPQIA
jgi:transaldolase